MISDLEAKIKNLPHPISRETLHKMVEFYKSLPSDIFLAGISVALLEAQRGVVVDEQTATDLLKKIEKLKQDVLSPKGLEIEQRLLRKQQCKSMIQKLKKLPINWQN